MTIKQKVSILLRFFFFWLLPRVTALLFVGWLVFSTLEIGMANPAEIGRDYWEYNCWVLLMSLF